MKRIKFLITICVLAASTFVNAADNMKAFPPAEEGMVRYVYKMPKQDDDNLFKVELIVGKMVKVDKDNRYFFGGDVKRETIEGWGFSYYKVEKLGPMAGTLMAVDPNQPKVERFISVNHQLGLLRYNSCLPLVVYAPEGIEVRYRLWRGDAETVEMTP